MSRTAFHLVLAALALLVFPVAIIAFNWAGEDCFITYRYAENLAEGHGAVFNTTESTAEERVEGYSNPTMMFLLAGVHRLGGSTIYGSRWVAALSAAGTVMLLGLMALSLGGTARSHSWALLPAAMFALQPVIHYQVGRALEATLLTFFLTLSAHLFIQRRMILASVALALTAWSRPEAFLYVGPFLAAFAIEWWLSRTEDQRSRVATLFKLLVPWALATIAMFVVRRYYYGHWMPNSVALKTTPGAFGSSLPLVRDFIVSWSFLPVLIPFAATGIRTTDPIRRRALLISGLLIAHQLAFIVAVGNVPASPFRHFVPLIPFACLLIAESVALAGNSMPSRWLRVYAVVALLGLNLYTVNNHDAPRTRLHVRLKEFIRNYGGSLNNPIQQFAFHWDWFHSPPRRVDAEVGRWVWSNLPHDILIAADQMGRANRSSRIGCRLHLRT
jgi:hypothetical protein